MPISLETSKAESAILNLRNNIRTHTKSLASAVGKLVYDQVREVTGKQFYSLPQLRKLGFPYSRRLPVNSAGIDDRYINRQTGQLYTSIRRTTVTGNNSQTVTVWAGAPYAMKLLQGTARMRPRDFMGLAMELAKAKANREQQKFLNEVENGKE